MFESPVLIFKLDEFLLISPKEVNFFLKVGDDNLLLVSFDLEWRVEIGGSFRVAHLIIKSIKQFVKLYY